MAYATGIANSAAEVRAAIVSLAVSNGWTSHLGDSTTITGSYSRTSNTVTVTSNTHGIQTGTNLYLDFTSGSASDGFFTVTGTTTDTFTITHTSTGTTSGNVVIYKPDIISKNNVYAKLTVANDDIFLRAGLGFSSNNITTQSTKESAIYGGATNLVASGTSAEIEQLKFPCTYHIFVNESPNNIVCFVNYNVNWWQWLMVGQANSLNNVSTDGVYQSASFSRNTYSSTFSKTPVYSSWTLTQTGTEQGGATTNTTLSATPFPFWASTAPSSLIGGRTGSQVYYQGAWRETDSDGLGQNTFNTRRFALTFLNILPNDWNNEITFIRAQIVGRILGTTYSYLAELPHIRFTRNDNYNDGDTITLGSEQWMIFPGLRKNTASRNSGSDHSGTVAIAVRKTT